MELERSRGRDEARDDGLTPRGESVSRADSIDEFAGPPTSLSLLSSRLKKLSAEDSDPERVPDELRVLDGDLRARDGAATPPALVVREGESGKGAVFAGREGRHATG